MDRGANRAIVVGIVGGMLGRKWLRRRSFGGRGGRQRARAHPLEMDMPERKNELQRQPGES